MPRSRRVGGGSFCSATTSLIARWSSPATARWPFSAICLRDRTQPGSFTFARHLAPMAAQGAIQIDLLCHVFELIEPPSVPIYADSIATFIPTINGQTPAPCTASGYQFVSAEARQACESCQGEGGTSRFLMAGCIIVLSQPIPKISQNIRERTLRVGVASGYFCFLPGATTRIAPTSRHVSPRIRGCRAGDTHLTAGSRTPSRETRGPPLPSAMLRRSAHLSQGPDRDWP